MTAVTCCAGAIRRARTLRPTSSWAGSGRAIRPNDTMIRTTRTVRSRCFSKTASNRCILVARAGHQHPFVLVDVVEHLARAEHHAQERIIDHVDGQDGFFLSLIHMSEPT